LPGLPAPAHLGSIALTVRDLDRLTTFYRDVIGLEVLESSDAQVALGAGEREILRLIGDSTAEREPLRAGLFHLAILIPTRKQLAESLVRLVAAGHVLGGASDHGVGEALYLSDSEGNGIELYRDRPREHWPRNGDALAMVTENLDLADLVSEAGPGSPKQVPKETRLGHVHLHVTDISEAEQHYVGQVGFGLMQRYGDEAAFFGAGGYHHHLGVNVWGPPRAPAEHGQLGLRWFDLVVPDPETVARITSRRPEDREMEGDAPVVHDPAGNTMRVVCAESS
jgi:catechol 2,3-dioxygenase